MNYYSAHEGLGETQEELRTRARELYAAGQQAFDEGRYEAALASFQEAYSTYSLPTVFIAIATTQMRLGRYAEAKQAAQRYLYADPEGPQAAQARELLRKADIKTQTPKAPTVPSTVPEESVGPPPPASVIYDESSTIAVWAITGVGVLGLIGIGYWLTRPKKPKRNRRRRRTSRRR